MMIDDDLAVLYGVATKALDQAARRNIERLPEDFMFLLTAEEAETVRSQTVTSEPDRGGRRYRPYASGEDPRRLLPVPEPDRHGRGTGGAAALA